MLLYRKGGKIDGRSAMPDFIKPYTTSNTKFSNDRYWNLKMPSDLNGGYSLGADADGFFIHTHRARSKSRMDLNFTEKERKFIESTG